MSSSTIQLDEPVLNYLREVSVRESDVLRDLREETAGLEESNMQISPEQGQLMTLLVELIGVERAIEVGTFTGYSAICVARALTDEGELVACDVSDEWTSIARRYWERAGVEERIRLELRPALETIDTMLGAGEAGTFDFAFIDADKERYPTYYEKCLELVGPGGVVAVDNTLWSGSVADPDDDRETTTAIRSVNARIGEDERVTQSLIPIGDGLTIARKRNA